MQQDLIVSCLGAALRLELPMIIGKKVTGYFEVVKPLVEFQFQVIKSRGNNVFELATLEEMDKLGGTTNEGSSSGQFADDINLDEVKNHCTRLTFKFTFYYCVCNTFTIPYIL